MARNDPCARSDPPRLAGDKRALARGISLVENDDPEGLGARPRGLPADRQRRIVVGFTGPPGVGKSTLIGALTKHRARAEPRGRGAVDRPLSSPFTRARCSATASG